MDCNAFSMDVMMPGSYSPSERDMLDPRLEHPWEEWHVREASDQGGRDAFSTPSPWNPHGSYMSACAFDGSSVTNPPYVASESSVSFQYSSTSSAHNGFNEWDFNRGSSTPEDGTAFSPENDTDSLEGFAPQLPFPGLEHPSELHQGAGCNAYGHDLYSISSEHEHASGFLFHHHQSLPGASFEHAPRIIAPVADSNMGSPNSMHLQPTSHPMLQALSLAEEKEIASSRRSSPVSTRTTRPTNKEPKAAPKLSSRHSKISKPVGKIQHGRSGSKSSKAATCPQCQTRHKDGAALDKHIKQHHTRPFICVFHYAGCKSNFATKNEWKRHVQSQHLYLTYYHCEVEECATAKPTSARRRPESLPPYGGIFNRKDLYTQHVRRMHQQDDKRKKPSRQAEEQLKLLQVRAVRKRCNFPTLMYCPADNCNDRFVGDKAWDERMEHVARHLEKAAAGEEPPVRFGGDHDPSLSAWVESPEVDVVRRVLGGWKLNNPIKGGGSSVHRDSEGTYDEDAEGEEC